MDNVGRVEFSGEAKSLKEGVDGVGVKGETKGSEGEKEVSAGREGAMKGEEEGVVWAGRERAVLEKLLRLRISIQLRIV